MCRASFDACCLSRYLSAGPISSMSKSILNSSRQLPYHTIRDLQRGIGKKIKKKSLYD